MKTRNRILAASLAALAVAGLTVGVAVAAGSQDDPPPTVPTESTAPGVSMHDSSMMTGSMMSGMEAMMNGTDMSAMHDAMHTAMRDTMSAELLAACDDAHDAMSNGDVTPSAAGPNTSTDHAAHHTGG